MISLLILKFKLCSFNYNYFLDLVELGNIFYNVRMFGERDGRLLLNPFSHVNLYFLVMFDEETARGRQGDTTINYCLDPILSVEDFQLKCSWRR